MKTTTEPPTLSFTSLLLFGAVNIPTPKKCVIEKKFPISIQKELDNDGAYTISEGDTIHGIGLQYYGARYLDNKLGMWTSLDPAEQFWSGYSYMGNGFNPIGNTDPDGEYATAVIPPLIVLGFLFWNTEKINAPTLDPYEESYNARSELGQFANAITPLLFYTLIQPCPKPMPLSTTRVPGAYGSSAFGPVYASNARYLAEQAIHAGGASAFALSVLFPTLYVALTTTSINFGVTHGPKAVDVASTYIDGLGGPSNSKQGMLLMDKTVGQISGSIIIPMVVGDSDEN